MVGVWERGRFEAARPDLKLSEFSVPVVVGTQDQLFELNALLVIYHTNYNPTLVIGGGKVGCAAAASLKARGSRSEIPIGKNGENRCDIESTDENSDAPRPTARRCSAIS